MGCTVLTRPPREAGPKGNGLAVRIGHAEAVPGAGSALAGRGQTPSHRASPVAQCEIDLYRHELRLRCEGAIVSVPFLRESVRGEHRCGRFCERASHPRVPRRAGNPGGRVWGLFAGGWQRGRRLRRGQRRWGRGQRTGTGGHRGGERSERGRVGRRRGTARCGRGRQGGAAYGAGHPRGDGTGRAAAVQRRRRHGGLAVHPAVTRTGRVAPRSYYHSRGRESHWALLWGCAPLRTCTRGPVLRPVCRGRRAPRAEPWRMMRSAGGLDGPVSPRSRRN